MAMLNNQMVGLNYFTSNDASMVPYLRVQVLFLQEIFWRRRFDVLFVQPNKLMVC